jgi:putative ATPase
MDFTHLLRPQTFDEVVGQSHLVAPEAPLRVLAQKGVLGHTFLYGPAGVGKTSLARIIAKVMDLPFYEMNATSLKIEELRKIFSQYKNTLQKPLIFIDEVHRLSKNQQEVLLPVMENNSVVIIGASTENPFYSLTSAMRSRSLVFELFPLTTQDLATLLERVLTKTQVVFQEDAKEYLIYSSGGDARAMLKLVEYLSALNTNVTRNLVQSLRPNALQVGSSENTTHYDLTSALIKSIRGSDCDASLYYLARLIEGGESADFIARRLVILASEDVGNANPQALTLATSCLTSVKQIGFPEARIILAQTVVYLCGSPKSNSVYLGINKALDMVKNGTILAIPEHIKQDHKGYLYPHDFGGFVPQEYLTHKLKLLELKEIGYEKRMKEWLEKLHN